MNSALPNSSRAVFRSFGVPRTRAIKTPKVMPAAKPFYQRAAKKQVEQYMKIAGGRSYLKSPFEKAFRAERQAYEHGQREGLSKEELYALSKVSHGGAITKEKAKLIAGAAVKIAREHQTEAGELAHGLGHGKLVEAERKVMRIEHQQEPKPEPVVKDHGPSAGQRLTALQQRVGIQHGPVTNQPSTPTTGGVVEPTHLADTSAAGITRAGSVTHWQAPYTEEQSASTPPPTAPRLSVFSSGLTGGIGTVPHPTDEGSHLGSTIPVLHEAPTDAPEAPPSTPAESAPATQLPDTSHVDEGLPF